MSPFSRRLAQLEQLPLLHREALLEEHQQLSRLYSRMTADKAAGRTPILYFVFTGHGQRGPAGEGTVSLLDGAFTRTDLYQEVIAPSTASFLHLIVDACDSYFFVNSRGALPVGPAQKAAVAQHLASRELDRYPPGGRGAVHLDGAGEP